MSETSELGSPDRPKLNGDNFTQYLVDRVDYDESDLPQELDLALFSNIFIDTYTSKETGKVFRDENRQKLMESVQTLRARGMHDLADASEKTANMEAEAERSRNIYLNHISERVEITAIQHGDHASVKGQTIPLLLEGKLPLIDIHTHPQDNPFSPQDYIDLLTDLFPSGSKHHARMVGALVVLTPNFQYLALPTTNTPLVNSNEGRKEILTFLNASDPNKQRKITHFEARFGKLTNHLSKYPSVATEELLKEVVEIEERRKNGEFDEATAKRMADDLIPGYKESLQRYMHRLSDLIIRTQGNVFDAVSKNARDTVAKAPDLINVVLYQSQDYQHFKQFKIPPDFAQQY